MKPLLSTTNYASYALYGAEGSFRLLKEIGYDKIDYGTPCDLYEYGKGLFSMPEKDFIAFFEKDAAYSRQYGLPVGQVHAPFPTWPESGDPEELEYMLRALEKSLQAAAIMGSPYLVMHCAMVYGWGEDLDPQRTKEQNFRIFERLVPIAEKLGVKIALENMPMVHVPSCFPSWLIQMIDAISSDYLVACLDTGHANLSGLNCGEYIRALGDRLQVLHLHDNEYGRIYKRGNELDQHTCPFLGNVNWQQTFAALKEIGYAGTFSLESDLFPARFPKEMYPTVEKFQHDILQQAVKLYFEDAE